MLLDQQMSKISVVMYPMQMTLIPSERRCPFRKKSSPILADITESKAAGVRLAKTIIVMNLAAYLDVPSAKTVLTHPP